MVGAEYISAGFGHSVIVIILFKIGSSKRLLRSVRGEVMYCRHIFRQGVNKPVFNHFLVLAVNLNNVDNNVCAHLYRKIIPFADKRQVKILIALPSYINLQAVFIFRFVISGHGCTASVKILKIRPRTLIGIYLAQIFDV